MKRLLLLRHARAVPHGTVNDFDRELAGTGRHDMVALARHLASLETLPDLALVSPSARTRETWELCGLTDVPVRFEELIYEASLSNLLRLIRGLPETAKLPILVGHNPSFEELTASLSSRSRFTGLPTSGLVLGEWPISRWSELAPGEGRLVSLATPATLGTA